MNTIVQQSPRQRNQRIAAKSLYAILGIAAAIELYGLLHRQYLPLLTIENSVIFATSFLLIFAFVWLTGKRNIQVIISDTGVEIGHDEEIIRFTWQDVKYLDKPAAFIRPYWLFELNNTQKIKISTRCFSKKQLRQIRDSLAKAPNQISSPAAR